MTDLTVPATPASGSGESWPAISFEDRMGTVIFRVAPEPHIVVDGDACRGCSTRACVAACPANLFVPTADGGILFNYEQCFECGTCYLVCNTEGAITWHYPEGGHGVVFPAELTMRFGVCLKLQDRRPEVDPLTGAAHHDPRFTGLSDADQAALEWALRCADAWRGTVVAVTAGSPVAEGILHFALGDGAEARRVNLASDAPSETVAAALAPALAGCDLVWCGDQSLDRGSGSVPAYLAALLGARQALGLVAVELDGTPGVVTATRRLDGGRRERLRVRTPGVLSVEGATARLRRASVGSWLAARRSAIDVLPGPPVIEQGSRTIRPFRPRARVLPAPVGHTARERIVALTDTRLLATAATTALTLEPGEAAARILAALAEWGYRDA